MPRGVIGREAFARRARATTFDELRIADSRAELTADELERFAIVARLLGEDEQSALCWERAHQARRAAWQEAQAARCAFWLAEGFMELGEMARAGGGSPARSGAASRSELEAAA